MGYGQQRLTNLKVLSLAAHGTSVMAGTSPSGIFFSENNGATWAPADTGLRPLPILALALDDSVAFTAPRGYGVWRRPLWEMVTAVTVEIARVRLAFTLEQNYPNPFNPSTTIKYELPKSTMVALSVFDILGREVSVLVNERRDAGVHAVKFDGSGLSSGVYLYRLTAGSFAQSRKFLLLR